jgi:hypothetical protein
MFLLLVLSIPLVLAWRGWFESDQNQPLRRRLSTVGLLLASAILLLFIVTDLKIDSSHGISLQVSYLKQ